MEKGYDTFTSMAAVRAAFSSAGNPWFSRDTMKWFNCKIESSLIGGRYFITSEQHDDYPRLYSVRKVVRYENGGIGIDTIGEFQQHATLQAAREALKEYREENN
jgi:hypothetical protein